MVRRISASARLTSRGRVTIPKSVRERLGLSTGDRVEFVPADDGGFKIVPVTVDIAELKGVLAKSKRPVTLEEMDGGERRRRQDVPPH